MVRAEHQLAPGLVQCGRGVLGPGQPGQRREPLAVEDRGLRGPLGLLGVDVGHVLAGVDRVHVPGLRRDPDVALRRVLAHGGEELRRHRDREPGPDVTGVPVPVDAGDPAGRDHVVGADRQQHVAGGRHGGKLAELLEGGLLRRLQARGAVGHPARPVVVRHVAGQQAAAVWRQPLELRGELHPPVVAHGAVRAPLVERAPGPGRLRQPGRGHHARVGRIMPERVEHPRCGRVRAQHLALVAQAVDGVADRGLGAGQVGVRLVVTAADDLDPARPDELEQVRAVLRMGVEVRLEVVDLGQHELVVRVAPGLVEMQPDQLEGGSRVRQAAVGIGQEDPGLGELALGAPPDRVIVEVADHPHRPPGLGGGDRGRPLHPERGRPAAGRPGALGDDGDLPGAARRVRRRHLDADLDLGLLAGAGCGGQRRLRGGHSRPRDADGDRARRRGPGLPGPAGPVVDQGHADDRQGPCRRPPEQLRRGHAADPHASSSHEPPRGLAGPCPPRPDDRERVAAGR